MNTTGASTKHVLKGEPPSPQPGPDLFYLTINKMLFFPEQEVRMLFPGKGRKGASLYREEEEEEQAERWRILTWVHNRSPPSTGSTRACVGNIARCWSAVQRRKHPPQGNSDRVLHYGIHCAVQAFLDALSTGLGSAPAL